MIAEIRLVVQLAVGVVFLLSVTAKLRYPLDFARGVADYQIVPRRLAYGVGLLLIPLEGCIAVSHLTGWLLAMAVPLGFAMLATFAVAVGVVLKRGQVLRCYCFGGRSGETVTSRTLMRLMLLLGGEALLFADPRLFRASRSVYPHQIAGVADLGLTLVWTAVLLVAGLWLLSVPEVVDLLRPRGASRGGSE